MPKNVDFYVNVHKAKDSDGRILAGTVGNTEWNWWNAMLFSQELGPRLLNPRQWSEALIYGWSHNEELACDMVRRQLEFTRGIVAHADVNGNFSPSIRCKIPSGSDTIFLEDTVVSEEAGRFFIDLEMGEAIALKEYPRDTCYLQYPIRELGMPMGSHVWVDRNYSYLEGVRPVIRGYRLSDAPARRFRADVHWGPSESSGRVGFRQGRAGTSDRQRHRGLIDLAMLRRIY